MGIWPLWWRAVMWSLRPVINLKRWGPGMWFQVERESWSVPFQRQHCWGRGVSRARNPRLSLSWAVPLDSRPATPGRATSLQGTHLMGLMWVMLQQPRPSVRLASGPIARWSSRLTRARLAIPRSHLPNAAGAGSQEEVALPSRPCFRPKAGPLVQSPLHAGDHRL